MQVGLFYSLTWWDYSQAGANLARLKQVLEGLTWLAQLEMEDLDRLTILTITI